MNTIDISEKIALVTDSSADLLPGIIEKYSIYSFPLRIIYGDGDYGDNVDITSEEVYERLEEEVPKTSMPSASDVINLFNTLKEKGYKKILSIHLSCNLSGTVDMVRLISKDFEDMEIEVFDTKQVSIGTGLVVYQAAKYIEQGLGLQEIKDKLTEVKDKIKVFFCIPRLDYLRKGGRIGLVAATLGTLMDLKPIISVNHDGRYYSHAKVRGRKKSLEKLTEIVTDLIKDNNVNVALYHGAAKEDALEIKEHLTKFPNIQELFFGQIAPSMAVHTGPGLVGVAIHTL